MKELFTVAGTAVARMRGQINLNSQTSLTRIRFYVIRPLAINEPRVGQTSESVTMMINGDWFAGDWEVVE